MPFTKMHALGNDYIYLDAVSHPALAARPDLPQLARILSHRRTGIGADGLIIIQKPEPDSQIKPGSGVAMRIFNADGSEAELCGNGIRCVAKYAVEHGLVPNAMPGSLAIESITGLLHHMTYTTDSAGLVNSVSVDMGVPTFDLPVNSEHLMPVPGSNSTYTLNLQTHCATPATLVAVGNPHAVFFMETADALDAIDLATLGPAVENHPAFRPHRINAHFVHVRTDHEITMRTWERGSGITQACGTGACAVGVACILLDKTPRTAITAHLPGGQLTINWSPDDNHVYMTGPATEVFTGTCQLPALPGE
ncbi:MAG: diaminopimelate epimerase [Planctomycetes bacterium]|nr:diaminopimelate epimerase [Planctomycetota bacterium]